MELQNKNKFISITTNMSNCSKQVIEELSIRVSVFSKET